MTKTIITILINKKDPKVKLLDKVSVEYLEMKKGTTKHKGINTISDQ